MKELRRLLPCMVIGAFLWVGMMGCGPAAPEGKAEGQLQISATFDAQDLKTGQNSLTVVVKRAATGAPITDAVVKVYPHMPAHGHGSTEDPKVQSMGEGKYKATPVTFQMPGEWEIVIDAAAGPETGKFTFSVNVK